MLDKKGFVVDKFAFIIAVLIIGMVLVISYVVFSNINDAIQSQDIDAGAKQEFQDFTDDYVGTWDTVFLIYFVGVMLAGFIFLLLLDTTPAIYFFVWMTDVFLLWLAAALANTYDRFQGNPEITSFSNDFFWIPFVLSHFLEILLVVTVIYAVVFFVKTRRQTTGGGGVF